MNSRQVAQRCLLEWHQRSDYAEDIFARMQREVNISGSNRGFARELFYGVLRNLIALDFVISGMTSRPPSLEPRIALQLGIYQLLFLHTPAHAAVSETVDLVSKPQRGFLNGVLRSVDRNLAAIETDLARQPAQTRFSHPDFLIRNWSGQYGENSADQIARWNNTPAEVFLRRNSLLTSTSTEGLEVTAHPLIFRATGTLPETLASGEFYAQDPGTLVAPELLDPQQGENILDACAAPGGKTSYLAALMQNSGTITATDSDGFRLARLRENLTRLGVTNTNIELCDWENCVDSSQIFDAVLADVPCSNTGVMRRRIDVRWRLRPDTFREFASRQLAILENLWPHVRSGGRLVYSTCSLEKTENEDVVETFLSRNSSASLAKTERRLPHVDGCDGSYAALLIRQ